MIADRLRKIVEYKRVSQRAFAISIGTSSQVFGTYLKNTDPSYRVLCSIIELNPDISAEWLLTGKGNMIHTESDNPNVVSDVEMNYRVSSPVPQQLMLDFSKIADAAQTIARSNEKLVDTNTKLNNDNGELLRRVLGGMANIEKKIDEKREDAAGYGNVATRTAAGG